MQNQGTVTLKYEMPMENVGDCFHGKHRSDHVVVQRLQLLLYNMSVVVQSHSALACIILTVLYFD